MLVTEMMTSREWDLENKGNYYNRKPLYLDMQGVFTFLQCLQDSKTEMEKLSQTERHCIKVQVESS